VLTSTPEKERLSQLVSNKKKCTAKKPVKRQRRVAQEKKESDTSESEEEPSLTDSCGSDMELDDVDLSREEIGIGSYLIVKFSAGDKRKPVNYVGTVPEIHSEDETYDVKFLRESTKMIGRFVLRILH